MDNICATEWDDDCEAWGWAEVLRMRQSLRTRAWIQLDHLPPYAPLGVCADLEVVCDWAEVER